MFGYPLDVGASGRLDGAMERTASLVSRSSRPIRKSTDSRADPTPPLSEALRARTAGTPPKSLSLEQESPLADALFRGSRRQRLVERAVKPRLAFAPNDVCLRHVI